MESNAIQTAMSGEYKRVIITDHACRAPVDGDAARDAVRHRKNAFPSPSRLEASSSRRRVDGKAKS